MNRRWIGIALCRQLAPALLAWRRIGCVGGGGCRVVSAGSEVECD